MSSVDFLCRTSMGEPGIDIKERIASKDRKQYKIQLDLNQTEEKDTKTEKAH